MFFKIENTKLMLVVMVLAWEVAASEKPDFSAPDCYKQLSQDPKIPKAAHEGVFKPSGEFHDTVSWQKTGLTQEVPIEHITKMRRTLAWGGGLRAAGRIGVGLSLLGAGANYLKPKCTNDSVAFGAAIIDFGEKVLIVGAGISSIVAWRIGSRWHRPAAQWLGARILGAPGMLYGHSSVGLRTVTDFAARRFKLPPNVEMQVLNAKLVKEKLG